MHGRVRHEENRCGPPRRNPFGGVVVCGDRDLLVEEAPDAYKNIEHVIDDLVIRPRPRRRNLPPARDLQEGGDQNAKAGVTPNCARNRGREDRR